MNYATFTFRGGDGGAGGTVIFLGNIKASNMSAEADTAGLPIGTLYYDTNNFVKRKAE